MQVNKQKIADLNLCYAIGQLEVDGERSFVVATEKEGECQRFDLQGNYLETVWTQPGGVMTILQVPNSNGSFLATHKFYSPNNSAEAYLVHAIPVDEQGRKVKNLQEKHTWKIVRLCDMPFVHRFGILKTDQKSYLIACTLKSGHEYKDDWTHPGKVLIAELPENLDEYDADKDKALNFSVLQDGLTKNHGFSICEYQGKQICLIATDNGLFRITPPYGETDWQVEQLTDLPSSDVRMIDIDGDGNMEYMVFAPFHGEDFYIYRETEKGLEIVYQHPQKMPFLHALWAGELAGQPAFIAGNRRDGRDLYMITWNQEKQDFEFRQVDHDYGPTNVDVYHYENDDYIIATNRETNEVALYKVCL